MNQPNCSQVGDLLGMRHMGLDEHSTIADWYSSVVRRKAGRIELAEGYM